MLGPPDTVADPLNYKETDGKFILYGCDCQANSSDGIFPIFAALQVYEWYNLHDMLGEDAAFLGHHHLSPQFF